MAEPAYTRMQVDVRRRQLLELGADLFARHSFAELSMARIAREAGISKALLYHYFPTKRDFFLATLLEAAEEVRRRTEPDPALSPGEALAGSLDAFLDWFEHRDLSRAELREFLLGSLAGALTAAGSAAFPPPNAPPRPRSPSSRSGPRP